MNENGIFKGEYDRFFGVSVNSKTEPKTEKDFSSILEDSISVWKEKKVRAVWMNVYLEHSFWIPVLVKNGFNYHHAKPNYVTMVKWLPKDEPYQIPSFAHNTLGVGGFVVNEADELLVVRERFQSFPHWKLPGGYVEVDENLSDAAIREVKEETGVDAVFESLLAFRHMHKTNFGCSDLYFIVILKPVSHDITMCKRELADCKWMKLTDYVDHQEVHETNKFFARCYLEGKANGTCIKMTSNKLQFKNFSKDQFIYHVNTDRIPTITNSNDVSKGSETSSQL
ncbi:UNVERIFIED_CONTAM: hypothetical protein RMT77_009686 [Armadillidium vulgare]